MGHLTQMGQMPIFLTIVNTFGVARRDCPTLQRQLNSIFGNTLTLLLLYIQKFHWPAQILLPNVAVV